ncbi:TPA: helix-turn-helix transcriptional regulator [Stenotrophomonas maltophilia]|nr:helix-turn-helix transcriptional regulator [Stenotrophomonas maltophilia]HEL3786634.1 helix-turn-helix transcriptional regulator [Stenotrophomonas maltophilia]
MAGDANTPRKASAKLLKQQLHSLQLTAGILIKSTRSYKRSGKPDGRKQTDVATVCGTTQTDMSRIENGSFLPGDPMLQKILVECGFDVSKPGGASFLKLLKLIRDEASNIDKIKNEKP